MSESPGPRVYRMKRAKEAPVYLPPVESPVPPRPYYHRVPAESGVTAYEGRRDHPPPPAHRQWPHLARWAIVGAFLLFLAFAAIYDGRAHYADVQRPPPPPCQVAAGHPCVLDSQQGEITVSVGYRGYVTASTSAVPPRRTP